MGSAATLPGPTYVIDAQSGRSDPNHLVLYHSFGAFSLTANEQAVFTGPLTTQNIFVRVTGGSLSSIEGLIDTRSSMPAANLFLLNPSGVMFGGSAKLNVGGSFHASTADYVRFEDGTTFSADLSQNVTLTVAPPQAFGFLASNTATLAVNGGELTVAREKTISLIGGQPTISAGTLKAPGGTIQVINAHPGEILLERASTLPASSYPASAAPAHGRSMQLPEGSVVIRSGRLFLDHANIVSSNGGIISIKAARSAEISGGEISSSSLFGPGGDIKITAAALSIRDGASIASSNLFSLDPTGSITIHAGTFELGASSIHSLTAAEGAGGSININVDGNALITDAASIQSSSSFSSPFALSSEGLPGPISLQVGSLTLKGAAKLGVGDVAGTGSGNVSIVATGPIAISERAGIITQASGEKPVGAIFIDTSQLHIDNGYISSSTVDIGRAGDVTLNVSSLMLTNGGQIASGSLLTARGRAGNITVPNAASIFISGSSPDNASSVPGVFTLDTASSGIFTTTAHQGEGGNIKLAASQIELHGGGKISADSTSTFAETARRGNIDITFGERLLLDHSSISTASMHANGGNISITSTGSLLQLIDSQITTSVSGGNGAGGNITLGSSFHPLAFLVLSKSTVEANSFGGAGGNIGIFSDTFLNGNSSVTASSQLSIPGTIDVEARITDASNSLAQLPGEPLQAQNLLRTACAARTAEGRTSSLVVAGREGVPPEPSDLLSSPFVATLAEDTPTSNAAYESGPLTASAGLAFESSCSR